MKFKGLTQTHRLLKYTGNNGIFPNCLPVIDGLDVKKENLFSSNKILKDFRISEF